MLRQERIKRLDLRSRNDIYLFDIENINNWKKKKGYIMAHFVGLPVRLGNREVQLMDQLSMISVWIEKYSKVSIDLCSRVKKGKFHPCRLIGFFPPPVLHTDY